MATRSITISNNVAAGSWTFQNPALGTTVSSRLVNNLLSTADIDGNGLMITDSDTGDGSFVCYFRVNAANVPSNAVITQLNFQAQYEYDADTEVDGVTSLDVGWALKDETNTPVVAPTSLAQVISGDGGFLTFLPASTALSNISPATLSLYQVGIYGKITNSDGSGGVQSRVNSLTLMVTYTAVPGIGGRRSSVRKFWRN